LQPCGATGQQHPAQSPAPGSGTSCCNNFGLYDIHGNVWQWCADYYGKYDLSQKTNPAGPAKGDDNERRVLRGGSGSSDGRSCRSAYRDANDPGNCDSYSGFRVALSAVRVP
jgi:formylglycine-generating enzyme required for sulfatase activity